MIKVILGRYGDVFFWLQISRIDGVSGFLCCGGFAVNDLNKTAGKIQGWTSGVLRAVNHCGRHREKREADLIASL
jgi:hypothetical protein